MYLTQFVYGAIEVPSKLIVYYLLEKIGRRKTEAGAQLFAGISLMINIFIPKGEHGKVNTKIQTHLLALHLSKRAELL